MSSVVNKSGTRFVPKIRQRRVLSTQGPDSFKASKSKEYDKNVNKSEEQESNDRKEDEDSANNSSDEIEDEEGPKSKKNMQEDVLLLQDTVQNLAVGSSSYMVTQRRRSSRLDSLSSNIAQPVFNSVFNESSATPKSGRRLSNMSNSGLKKMRMNSISENDSALQALKKRRMSVRTSVSKRAGPAHRISIVPVENKKKSETAAEVISIPGCKRDSSYDLFQRTDNLYEKYTIRNLREIPKNIQDTDSSRYMIDESEFTMAELCKPVLPIGEPSENFERAKLASKAKLMKRKERRDIRKRAREEFKSLNSLNREELEKEKEERKKKSDDLMNADIPDFSQKSQVAIQLKMNKDGTMVVDELSTVVDRHKTASIENAQKTKVDENPFENLYNSATYGRNSYTDPWTNEELLKFYKALSMWGTDFNLISQLFPYRTRKQVKAKFINEERKHPVIIELALRSRLPPDFDSYCLDTKKIIGTISDFNGKLEELQKKHENHLKEIEEAKTNAKNEDLKNIKNKDINKKSSGGLMTAQLKTYRKSEIVLGTIDDRRKQIEGEDTATIVTAASL